MGSDDAELRNRKGAAPAATGKKSEPKQEKPGLLSKMLSYVVFINTIIKYACVFVCMVLTLNVVSPLDPAVTTEGIAWTPGETVPPPDPIRNVASVEDEFFFSNNVRCHGWLVLPKRPLKSGESSLPPVVVMAHGIGSTKDMGLYPYAVEFAEAGIASFLIDYRGFGLSGGEPRHLVSGAMHTADIVAAVESISADDRVDGARVAVWGTSLGGGHVVLAASRLGDKVRAVISQAPTLDGKANLAFNIKNRGVASTMRIVFSGVVDYLRNFCGLPSAYITLADLPGTLAVMTISQKELDQMKSKHPPNQTPPRKYTGGWENKTPARFLLAMPNHRPIKHLSKVHGPILFIQPSWDSVVPVELVDQALATKNHPRSRKIQISGGHFEVYKEAFPQIVPEMVKFLQEELA